MEAVNSDLFHRTAMVSFYPLLLTQEKPVFRRNTGFFLWILIYCIDNNINGFGDEIDFLFAEYGSVVGEGNISNCQFIVLRDFRAAHECCPLDGHIGFRDSLIVCDGVLGFLEQLEVGICLHENGMIGILIYIYGIIHAVLSACFWVGVDRLCINFLHVVR